MNMHKFSGYVLLLGILIATYGAILILTNLDRQFDPSKSRHDPIFGRMDLQQLGDVL